MKFKIYDAEKENLLRVVDTVKLPYELKRLKIEINETLVLDDLPVEKFLVTDDGVFLTIANKDYQVVITDFSSRVSLLEGSYGFSKIEFPSLLNQENIDLNEFNEEQLNLIHRPTIKIPYLKDEYSSGGFQLSIPQFLNNEDNQTQFQVLKEFSSNTLKRSHTAGHVEAYNFDIDGNGVSDALTDGVLIIRFLNGDRGATLVDSAVAAGSTRNTAEIESYLNAAISDGAYDIDQNGTTESATDGTLIIVSYSLIRAILLLIML